MRSTMFLGAVLTLLANSKHCLAEPESFPFKPGPVPYSEVIKLPYTQPEKISYGEDSLQTLHYWTPATKTHNDKVALVFIHGGCWLSDYDVSHSLAFTSALAEHGYTVWSVEYRRTGDDGGGWPGSYMDILASIDVISSRPETRDRDLILIGHSAGGHLAVLAGGMRDKLRGIVGLAAITHLKEYAEGSNSCQKATLEFMGDEPVAMPGRYAEADPIVQPTHKNTVLLHGEADKIVPLSHSKLENTQRVIVPQAGHFDWLHPESRAFSTLLQTLDTLTDDQSE